MTILTVTFRNRLSHLALALCMAALLAPAPVVNAQPGGAGQGNADAHRDPCEQSLQPPGNAEGLHRRCEGVGGGGGVARGDFNADGLADLAVGVPFEDQDGINAVGGVNIIYASATGLSAAADLFLDETDFGFPYASDDHFGWALASGDFNGDTFADLAIGMPDGDLGKTINMGRVFLIDGSTSGLDLATARQFVLLPSARTAGASAGEAMVWADFNGDGFGDLAVGAPGVSLPGFCLNVVGFERAGEVQVFYGGPQGLTQLGAQRLFQRLDIPLCGSNGGIGDFPPALDDRFGSALTAANFNGDVSSDRPIFDLVIGTPLDNLGVSPAGLPALNAVLDAGLVQIIPGSVNGLNVAQTQSLSQDSAGIGGGAERGDQFGRAVAVGDFNADLRDDLAIGVPFEDLLDNTAADAGAVHVLFGSFASGELVTTLDSRFISQTNLSGSSAEAGDRFGWALATGRFNNDFRSDLAIGSPGEDIDAIANAGIVEVLYGEAGGPSLTFTQLWRQGANGIPDAAESGDQFGYALSAWNYGRSTHSDLAIGVPFEDLISGGSQIADAGAVILIYGSFTNLSSTTINPAEFWHQNVSGVDDVAQVGDRFGHALY